jgi:hypothetical protein
MILMIYNINFSSNSLSSPTEKVDPEARSTVGTILNEQLFDRITSQK